MSKFLSEKYASLTPYTPGEQPKERKYVKLNTNESPFPPSPLAIKRSSEASKVLQLYSDPDSSVLTGTLARFYDVKRSEVLVTNGSDEALNFAFMAYCDQKTPAVFADITYGFYKVFALVNNVPYRTIPLNENFGINICDYFGAKGTIFIANPNAPTGIALSVEEIEQILIKNADNVVVIDEAYVDFGARSVVPLIKKYDNLLVTQTFSKSRSMAGARLGYAIGCEKLISDLNSIKYSVNPYNVNRMTSEAGIGALEDKDYFENNCAQIIENREWTKAQLENLGFELTNSLTNFLFARSDAIDGGTLYEKLKQRGVLVRHFSQNRISDYVRITIGSVEEMNILVENIKEILEESL